MHGLRMKPAIWIIDWPQAIDRGHRGRDDQGVRGVRACLVIAGVFFTLRENP